MMKALSLLLLVLAVNAEITGKIVSCSGWSLNRFPELKSFLKDGEAEYYKGVEVEYVHGRNAVITITKDGEEQEPFTMSDLKTKEEMHKFMLDSGFEKKSEEEIEEMKAAKKARDEANAARLAELYEDESDDDDDDFDDDDEEEEEYDEDEEEDDDDDAIDEKEEL